jgi:cell division septation protein DedD
MVTKVGHAKPMLICTDCGLPVDQRQTSEMARQRLWGALALVAMALISGAMLLLASINESRTAGFLEGSVDKPEKASGEDGQSSESLLLPEPSDLLKPPRMVKRAATPASLAPPEATPSQQDQQQGPSGERQP